jgi:hypothetical protein
MANNERITKVTGAGEENYRNKGYTANPLDPKVQSLPAPVTGPATPPPPAPGGDTASAQPAQD